ncbi:MAG: RNA-directed DNA polymerase [Selenomonadaceae bacterium]|nr:RNA-directed DNA polymerase [Selenomonadaceae bacterium]
MHIDTFTNEIKSTPKYKKILLPKKSGGKRKIFIPDDTTLSIQKAILQDLYELNIEIAPCVTAFKKKVSIVDNAKVHIGNQYLIRYDLRDFFDTITFKKVETALKSFNVDSQFLKIIKKWCFKENHLPQGAATSPFLSNLVCKNLDYRFSKLAEKISANYTRYADDIIISGDVNVLINQTVFKRIIRTEKFFINHHKIYVSNLESMPYHIVTGLTVNEKISVRPKYLERVWLELKKKIPVKSKRGINFENIIRSKITFVNFVDSEHGDTLFNYAYSHNIL